MGSTILICDDEPEIRHAMRRTLRDYLVFEASSAREALDALKTRAFDAIISDFSMGGGADGLDLLQLAKVEYPEMVRFLVTGNRDLDVAVRAVNEGAVHRYFLKPWNDDQLRAALEIVLHSRNPARRRE
ncbi:MAG: response regulator [Acidobacteriota bacterium]